MPSAKKITSKIISGIQSVISDIGKNEGFEVNIYQNLTVADGVQSNNPWLQEMPDPISKVCWDNYLSVNPKDARKMNISTDSGTMTTNLLSISLNDNNYEIPAIIQPGQAEGTVGLALGYGRTLSVSGLEKRIDRIANVFFVDPGVFNDIMEKRCHEALCIHVHTSKNTRHREGVSDVRLSAAAGLPVVGLFRVIVSTPDLLRLVQRQVVCDQLFKSGE